MPDLTPEDVQQYTGGRLAANDPAVARMLTAALSVMRRECGGWHVCPVRTDVTVIMDGSGTRVLWLPTLQLITLHSVIESGVQLAPAAVRLARGDGSDVPERARLRKTSGAAWVGSYGEVEVRMDHGFTEQQASDWRNAVLSMVDQMSLVPVSGNGTSQFGMTGQRVDDVDYRYNPYAVMAEELAFSVANVIEAYRLPAVSFY